MIDQTKIKRRGKHVQTLRDRINREVSAAKKSAGLTMAISMKKTTQAETGWRNQIGSMPHDTRSLTARLLGDPIPGDTRCPWRPQSARSAE